MENQLVKYYEAIVKHYNIPDPEFTYKEYHYYTLFEINNELFVVMTENQINMVKDSYIASIEDDIHLPYECRFLENYIDKEAYALDCWEESNESYFIDNLIEDNEFRFTYIDTLHEIPF